jgi:DNA ligase-1
MNRFAELLDRLAYEPGRNAKLKLIADYLRTTGDPERGWALAALTGALSFRHAKPGMIRALIAERTDPVLFALSHDYVGDLSETVALMWPVPLPPRSGGEGLGVGGVRGSKEGPPIPDPSPPLASLLEGEEKKAPSLTDVVATLSTLGKTQLPAQIARWLDALDETGRWALLKLVTGGLRIGVSARLAKTAAASLGGKAPDEVEMLWPGLAPPYGELFA